MSTHFPTVPVEGALRAARGSSSDRVRPLALIVDDDAMITGTLAAILNGSGLAAITARNGLAGLETARVIPPEILIADSAMPGLGGLDLAVEITRFSPDCEVILFAGHGINFSLSERMRRTGREFLVMAKPVHPADLLQAVFRLLSRRGHRVIVPKISRAPGMYDFLSTARASHDMFPTTCNVTRRLRERSATHLA